MRSLRQRLIAGMLLGMAALLLVAGAAIYAVQRQQLYSALDRTLLTAANAVSSLVHPGPFGYWFDAEGLTRLPGGWIAHAAYFQIWSDQPLEVGPHLRAPGPYRPPARPSDEDPLLERPSAPAGLFPGPPQPCLPPTESQPAEPPTSAFASVIREYVPASGLFVIRSGLLSDSDLPQLEPDGPQPRYAQILLPDGSPARAVTLSLVCSDRGPGPRRAPARLIVAVATSLAETRAQLRFLAALLAVTGVGTLALAAGVAWFVVGRGLRPLAAVAREIAAIDESDLNRRVRLSGVPRELHTVVSQLNSLLGRLETAFERERALTADVAHELRTPIAEIRTIAEITLQRLRDPQEYRQAVGEVLEAVRGVETLIERLLVLARLEAGQMKPELRAVSLRRAVLQRWVQFRDKAAAAGIDFDERCPEDALVLADPGLLEVVLSNALSNAVTYTPAGGRIAVDARQSASSWLLAIANSGCTLKPEDAERVFDRFWRADPARRQAGLNCGLGLTLIRRAMQAMGGQAQARITADREFVLELTFRA